MTKLVSDLKVGDVVACMDGLGDITVLTEPVIHPSGRADFTARNARGNIDHHHMVPTWEVEVR